ncbi:hypothetical protein ASPVEDRAFT_79718 [Aspergillus versicolor CBS 583.65]|uniref:C2H2-type domain-containing protein n=1 Tax=Aspergillus versicolor CBS 583.65 TaxID=1036611 RepID=A0A1L9P990_ASPVE|nr:uncharacterized protein ASPVEDRAFT_79718 [Aspergillus versicolor CBS 583.65]OJI98052.1 hypothetical protein ASPVEDRAFT_79718 [Aspergillus versicolor CBS 583.65]
MDLDRYLTYDGVDYECTICERFFASRRAIYDHCRDTSRHEWCEKCERVFLSEPAKNQHLRNSSNHNICWICPQIEDFEDSSDLDDHLVEDHHYCDPCDRAYSSARKLREHDVNVHHLCVKCNRFFGNENNLRMHRQTHQPRDMECYGCYQTFKSFSGMLIHLESGACELGTDEEMIDDIFCDWDRSWMFKLDNDEGGGWRYVCSECEREFGKLSALYQHAEDAPGCSDRMEDEGYLAELRRLIRDEVQDPSD